jgi:hypothetical protein
MKNGNNSLKLPINNKEYLVIITCIPWNKIQILQDIRVIFESRYLNLIIGEEAVMALLQDFINILHKVTKKECILPNGRCLTCRKDIGLCAVQSLVACIFHEDNTLTGDVVCSQQDYQLFGYKNKRASWLYNDKHENIVLEVTPWFDVRKYKNKVIFKKWIKNYRPILKRTIAPEIARKWILQMEVLLRTVRINSGL